MKIALLILLAFAAMQLNAQTLAHYQRIIKELSSSKHQVGNAFPWYHTVFDTYQTVRFESYEPVFRLVGDFIERYRPLP